MDMTRAPGYEVAADDESPLVGDKKIADFAARHARLSLTEVEHAPGYLWVGSVLYPFGPNPDVDILFSWENEVPKLDSEFGAANEEETDADEYVDQSDDEDLPALEAKRRYTGGQARRIRKERERNADRKPASRPSRRPIRKPENDIPEEA